MHWRDGLAIMSTLDLPEDLSSISSPYVGGLTSACNFTYLWLRRPYSGTQTHMLTHKHILIFYFLNYKCIHPGIATHSYNPKTLQMKARRLRGSNPTLTT